MKGVKKKKKKKKMKWKRLEKVSIKLIMGRDREHRLFQKGVVG
jgi:hypothetical protein